MSGVITVCKMKDNRAMFVNALDCADYSDNPGGKRSE